MFSIQPSVVTEMGKSATESPAKQSDVRGDCMTFICKAAQIDSHQHEQEESLFRFQIDDSYLAYTTDNFDKEDNDIVLKNGVYALK